MTAPCKNCKDRTLYCHSSCKRYEVFEDERQHIRKQRLQELNNSDYIFDTLAFRNLKRHRKEHYRKGVE